MEIDVSEKRLAIERRIRKQSGINNERKSIKAEKKKRRKEEKKKRRKEEKISAMQQELIKPKTSEEKIYQICLD
jgi:hypothetical protein